MNHETDLTDLATAVRQLVETHFSCLRRTVRKNLARLTCAFLRLASRVRESATCMLSMTRPRFEVEKRSVRRKTFDERSESGPQKMTVGCVILTVPRRKRVSHEVTAEIARARKETVIERVKVLDVFASTAVIQCRNNTCLNVSHNDRRYPAKIPLKLRGIRPSFSMWPTFLSRWFRLACRTLI